MSHDPSGATAARTAIALAALLLAAIGGGTFAQTGGPPVTAPYQSEGGDAGPTSKPKPPPIVETCPQVKARATSGACASKCQIFEVCAGQPAVPLACAPPPCG